MGADLKAGTIDISTVADVADIGNGEPLFMNFVVEDWTLVGLRFELHLLVHAFKHDVNDPDVTSFHEKNLLFYYMRYYKKPFNPKTFGLNDLSDFVKLVKDTIQLTSTSSVASLHKEDTALEDFVKLTERNRRERQRRVEVGDEAALLQFRNQPQNTNIAKPLTPQIPSSMLKPAFSAPSATMMLNGKANLQQAGNRSRGFYGSAQASGQKRPFAQVASLFPPSKQAKIALG